MDFNRSHDALAYGRTLAETLRAEDPATYDENIGIVDAIAEALPSSAGLSKSSRLRKKQAKVVQVAPAGDSNPGAAGSSPSISEQLDAM